MFYLLLGLALLHWILITPGDQIYVSCFAGYLIAKGLAAVIKDIREMKR